MLRLPGAIRGSLRSNCADSTLALDVRRRKTLDAREQHATWKVLCERRRRAACGRALTGASEGTDAQGFTLFGEYSAQELLRVFSHDLERRPKVPLSVGRVGTSQQLSLGAEARFAGRRARRSRRCAGRR